MNKIKRLESIADLKKQLTLLESIEDNKDEIFNIEYDYLAQSQASIHITRTNYGLCLKSINLLNQCDSLQELVHWMDPDWILDWNDNSQLKFEINIDSTTNIFGCVRSYIKSIGTVYASQKTSNLICTALNNGELKELAIVLKGY